jgi:hypothetical protein
LSAIPAEAGAWRGALALVAAARDRDAEATRVILGNADLAATCEALAAISAMALRFTGMGLPPGRFLEYLRSGMGEEFGP